MLLFKSLCLNTNKDIYVLRSAILLVTHQNSVLMSKTRRVCVFSSCIATGSVFLKINYKKWLDNKFSKMLLSTFKALILLHFFKFLIYFRQNATFSKL